MVNTTILLHSKNYLVSSLDSLYSYYDSDGNGNFLEGYRVFLILFDYSFTFPMNGMDFKLYHTEHNVFGNYIVKDIITTSFIHVRGLVKKCHLPLNFLVVNDSVLKMGTDIHLTFTYT